MVTNLDCEELLAILSFTTDARKAPDDARRTHFHTGWAVATNRETLPTLEAPEQLTWTSLGYRLGEQFGTRSETEIDSLFDRFAAHYHENNN